MKVKRFWTVEVGINTTVLTEKVADLYGTFPRA